MVAGMFSKVRGISNAKYKISLWILDEFFYRGLFKVPQDCELRDLFSMVGVCFNEFIQLLYLYDRLNVFELNSFQGSGGGDELIFEGMLLEVPEN